MGMHPSTIIISEDVFKRPECPKNFEAYVKQSYLGGEGDLICGKRFFVISWCEHYDAGIWDDLEEPLDKDDNIIKELLDFKESWHGDEEDENEEGDDYDYDSTFKYRVENWLDHLQSLHQELVF